MPRFFTLTEAEALLPQIERLIRSLVQAKREYERVDAEHTGILQTIAITGGMIPPREQIAKLRSHKDSIARSLKATVEKIQETGCQLKDVDLGLIDFPTLYKDREVYLCWKLGETGIRFWHHIEDGYRGRKPIDQEFLANHHSGRSS